ncbi:MAG: NAD-binding protein [Anaerolineae bacterium]|nr:NAD-binding protein [Phycisphaerae bacterium]
MSEPSEDDRAPFERAGHFIIAGYGLPGRAVAETLDVRQLPYCVLELNAATVQRCVKSGTHIVEGDVTDPEVLKRAHIESAAAIIIAIPDEKVALRATQVARELNPTMKIISRTHYISAGNEAKARGADAVIVAEQVVAMEMSRVVGEMFRVSETHQG